MIVAHTKICLITGASRGLGAALLTACASRDWIVIVTARTATGVAALDKYLSDNKVKGKAYALDCSSMESVRDFCDCVAKDFPQGVDYLVNNAGLNRDTLVLRMKEEDWSEIVQVNLGAAFMLSKWAVRGMLRRKHGRIVNISSVSAALGNAGQANYAASKAGLEAFTRSLAREVASKGITCNAVAPGFINTGMSDELTEKQRDAIIQNVPMQRMGSCEEVVHAVMFLLHQDAAYITGTVLNVNGGLVM